MAVVDDNGSPRGPKAFVIWNPPFFGGGRVERKSANVEAARILSELVSEDHQAIAFVRARVVKQKSSRATRRSSRRVSRQGARS